MRTEPTWLGNQGAYIYTCWARRSSGELHPPNPKPRPLPRLRLCSWVYATPQSPLPPRVRQISETRGTIPCLSHANQSQRCAGHTLEKERDPTPRDTGPEEPPKGQRNHPESRGAPGIAPETDGTPKRELCTSSSVNLKFLCKQVAFGPVAPPPPPTGVPGKARDGHLAMRLNGFRRLYV